MISVILAGRNDAHGGNVAKRAAISLNTLAPLLTAPDDEIIFVDWNTPDSEPSFVQAISDTLTQQARALIKVVRVRTGDIPDILKRTHLPLIDSIARNVGIRRSNAANRWILSTTTDVVLLPMKTSLADSLEGLDPVLHHSARHGLPEIGWEDLSRADPDMCRTMIADRIESLGLREIVRAPAPVLYDGPGDFQLIPRLLAHEIKGFDESLVFTYHTDANLAKRAFLKAGAVGDLSGRITVVHCDHYRTGSVHHSEDRITNAFRVAFDDVDTAIPPDQPETWGLAGQELEVFGLADEATQKATLRAVQHLVAGLPDAPQTAFTSEIFNTLTVPVGHVVPHLANLLAGFPADSGVGLLSVNPAMRDVAVELIGAMGHRVVEVDADLAIVDFSLEASNGDPTELLPVFQDVTDLLEWPTRWLVSDAAKIILINAIHTEAERLVNQRMRLTSHMPYTTRVRVAVARRGAPTDPTDLREISQTCRTIIEDRRLPKGTSRSDIAMALQDLLGPRDPESFRFPDPYLTIEIAESLAGRRPRLRALMKAAIETARAQLSEVNARLHPSLGRREPRHLTGVEPALSKLASVDDWENARWAAALGRLWFGPETRDRLGRHASMWRDGQIIHVAAMVAGAPGGAPALNLPALTLTEAGTPNLAVLDGLFPTHVIAVPDTQPSPTALRISTRRPFRPNTPIVPWDRISAQPRFGVIVVNGSWVWGGALETFLIRLAEFRARLLNDGVLVFGLEINIGALSQPGIAAFELMRDPEFWAILSEELGLAPFGEVDLEIDTGTVSRLPGAGDAAVPGMGVVTPAGGIVVPSVWCLQAIPHHGPPSDSTAEMARKVMGRLRGPGFVHSIEITSASVRLSEGGVVPSSDPRCGGLHGVLFRIRGLEIDRKQSWFSFRLTRQSAEGPVSGHVVVRAVGAPDTPDGAEPTVRDFEIPVDQATVGRVVRINLGGAGLPQSPAKIDVLVMAVDLGGVSFSEISLS